MNLLSKVINTEIISFFKIFSNLANSNHTVLLSLFPLLFKNLRNATAKLTLKFCKCNRNIIRSLPQRYREIIVALPLPLP